MQMLSAEESRAEQKDLPPPHLDVFLQLEFMLSRQLLMLPLELGDQ